MTLYQDFLYQYSSYREPELPTECNWIDDEIRFWNIDDAEMQICQASLIMFLEKMHDRIKELENQVQFLKGEM